MSEENVEIVREAMEASMREDWERAGELIDPRVEMHGTVGGLEEGRVARGLPRQTSKRGKSDGSRRPAVGLAPTRGPAR